MSLQKAVPSTEKPFARIAVLGAGVMGAQIAAHFANAGFQTLLFDLASPTGDKNRLVRDSLKGLSKLKPAPLFDKTTLDRMEPANYEQDLTKLQDCDFVLEAISERLDWKQGLYEQIVPYLGEQTIFASNTSGLSLNLLAQHLPVALRPRFCGVHFFNPPRYMALVELIASDHTQPEVIDRLEAILTTYLGKNIVRAKDTPNFVANRVGVFAMLLALYHAERLNIPFEVVDALTGPLLGRPKSATLRTADVVGLDTFAHVVTTMREALPKDPWHSLYRLPAWMDDLIQRGAMGQKSGEGVFKKEGKAILVYQPDMKSYRPAQNKPNEQVLSLLKKPGIECYQALQESGHPEAQFLWSCLRDLFHYCAVHCQEIAHTVRDIDQAMRWGFGWKLGPFETWQQAGWSELATLIENDIAAGKTVCEAELPEWSKQPGFSAYQKDGAYTPETKSWQPRRSLACYQRQCFPEAMLAETLDFGETLLETEAVRLWCQADAVPILSFKTKLGTISRSVLQDLQVALDVVERDYQGLVLWQSNSPHFSAGANLKEFVTAIDNNDFATLDETLKLFQQACLRLRYVRVPVVAAVSGYVFGGGCELMMHCDSVVAAAESYIGLVEAGVGLLPAGGGCKEMVQRTYNSARGKDYYPQLEQVFMNIAMGKASSCAVEAKSFGYLRETDTIVMHRDECLHVAKTKLKSMLESAYIPPVPQSTAVVGEGGLCRMQATLVNMAEGGFISAHDAIVAKQMASILCGGELDSASNVSEEWLLRLEREGFLALTETESTKQRIEYMLKTGKPLRN